MSFSSTRKLKRTQPRQLREAQQQQSNKRKIPSLPKGTKEDIWKRYRDTLIESGLNSRSSKRDMIDTLMQDDPDYQEYISRVRGRETRAALFQKAYAKDFNTSMALIQSRKNSKVPRMNPFTKEGPMPVSYLKYCGSGKKISFNVRTQTWSCEDDSVSSKTNAAFKENYGNVTKTSLRERSVQDLRNMVVSHGLLTISQAGNTSKKDLVDILASKLNASKSNVYKTKQEKVNKRRRSSEVKSTLVTGTKRTRKRAKTSNGPESMSTTNQ